MNTELSQALIEAAATHANSINTRMCIAVVDEGALLHSFKRMDGSFKGSVDVAISKARTSALFPFPSGVFGDVIRSENLTGMENSNGGLCCFAGGLPIMRDGVQIGAIGVSGGSAEQDHEVAQAALAALNLA